MIGQPDFPVAVEETDACKGEKPNVSRNYAGTTVARSSAKLLIVEGNIGVGKTTLARKLADELNYKLYLEPTVENPFLGKGNVSLSKRATYRFVTARVHNSVVHNLWCGFIGQLGCSMQSPH